MKFGGNNFPPFFLLLTMQFHPVLTLAKLNHEDCTPMDFFNLLHKSLLAGALQFNIKKWKESPISWILYAGLESKTWNRP
jgi:hypothetical protein